MRANQQKLAYVDVHVDLSRGDEEHAAETDGTRGRVEARRDGLAHGAHEVAVPLFASTRQRCAAPHFDVEQRDRCVATNCQ